ncbi:carbohydrate ABC transporter permease [uncultured Ilumatobacter sp.]|uniref:carbohydrate ABC transporter permease n=1 Tax=uncultured Ilumatobacter sp. TaxID=879968 RepID=UPI00374F9BBA
MNSDTESRLQGRDFGRLARTQPPYLARWSRNVPFTVFILPALIVYSVVVILPLIQTFRYSFTNYDGLSPEYDFVGLENYRKTLSSEQLIEPFIRTLGFSLVVPLLVTVMAIPLALVLNGRFKTRNFQRASFFFPAVLSALFLGYSWTFILSSSKYGMINALLEKFGFGRQLLLADSDLAMWLIVLVVVWASVGWHACLYLANLQTIDPALLEAADIDGASAFQRFRFITLPHLTPAMTVSVALLIIGSLKVFDLPIAMTEGGPGRSTIMMTQSIMIQGLSSSRVGLASAMSFLFFLVIAVITFTQVTLMSRQGDEN